MDQMEMVLRMIRMKGPVLPLQVAKEIGSNTFFAGAILSQLVDEKKIFLSHTKIGGSPVYYVKGQEWKLQELYRYLNEKDKRTFDLLKQRKLLRDNEQDPLTRVSLRNIRDFAIPLEVIIGDKKEIFWKWYLVPDSEVENLVGEYLKTEPKIEQSKTEAKNEEKKEVAEKIVEKKITEFEKKVVQKETKKIEQKKEIKSEIKDDFLEKIRKFFKDKNIEIIDLKIIKKNSEIDLVVRIPSSVGNLEYYCKAKNKKRVSDADLSAAYVKSQMKKMPVIFVSTGELTKNAKDIVGKDIKINFVRI